MSGEIRASLGESCQFQEPGEEPCGKPGRRLVLQQWPMGTLCVRVLCREHSDWEEAPEAVAARPRLRPGEAEQLRRLGISW